MKRRHASAALALATAALLAGCSAAAPSMSIQEVELTPEESSLLELVGTDPLPPIYEYQADSRCQTVELCCYLLDLSDYHWEASSSASLSASEAGGYLALLSQEDGSLQVSLSDGSGVSRCSFPTWEPEEDAGEGSIRETELPFSYGQELPLLVQVQSDADSHSIYSPQVSWEDPERYQNANIRQAALLTITFRESENGGA